MKRKIQLLLDNNIKHKVLINTIPHCGTHLVSSILDTAGYEHATYKKFGVIKKKIGLNWRLSKKLINFLPEKYYDSMFVSVASPKLVRFKIVENFLNKVDFGKYALSHIPYNENFNNYLFDNNWKGFFILRDPRDMCLSMLRHIENRPYHFGYFYLFKKLVSNSDRIEAIVRGFVNENNRKFVGIKKMYTSMLSWKNSTNFVSLKFEELVGKKGNGKTLNQLSSIKRILSNLDFDKKNLNTKLLHYIGNQSYGKSSTFRKGKIGNWREILTNKDIKIFKKHVNETIIKLGYEKNSRWN